jgi:hypothetical protein
MKWRLLIVSFLHVVVYIIIHLIPFAVWKGLLHTPKKVNAPQFSKRIMYLIRRSYFRTPTCLESSLVMHIILVCYGIKSSCCLGLQIENEKLVAHAWVESGGEVMGDEFPLGAYVRLYPEIEK